MASQADAATRVVSLVPSSTETLLALGAHVVACTRFCEQPELAHVGGTKNPDVAAIVDLAPDVVVLDREENRVEDHDALLAAGLATFVSDVTDLDSALAVVGELARVSGATVPADPDIARNDRPTRRLRAFVPIWRRPWMTISATTYGASLLEFLGVDVIEVGTGAYPTLELDDLAGLDVDVVLVPGEPYVFRDEHLEEITAAVPHTPVVRVDGQDLFWWGSRTPDALARLRSTLRASIGESSL